MIHKGNRIEPTTTISKYVGNKTFGTAIYRKDTQTNTYRPYMPQKNGTTSHNGNTGSKIIRRSTYTQRKNLQQSL